MDNEKYFHQYNKILNLLSCAYFDYFILEVLGKYNKVSATENRRLPTNALYVLRHYSELCKADLSLNVWKLYGDNNNNSCSLQHLNLCIHSISEVSKNSYSPQKPKCNASIKHAFKELGVYRNKYLAHTDVCELEMNLDIPQVFILLEYCRAWLNAMCIKNIDDRVFELDDCRLLELRLRAYMGLGNNLIEENLT